MLATACGYAPAEIDDMTFSDFQLLCDYWKDHPPPHLMIAGYLGIKPAREDPSDMADMLTLMPGWTKH